MQITSLLRGVILKYLLIWGEVKDNFKLLSFWSLLLHLEGHEEWPMDQRWCAIPYGASSDTPHQGGTGRTTHNVHYQGWIR